MCSCFTGFASPAFSDCGRHDQSDGLSRSVKETRTLTTTNPLFFFYILVTLFHRALIRPGRLEEHIALSLPDCAQRRACLLSPFDSETQTLLAGADGCSGCEHTVVEQRNKEIDGIARCTEQKYVLYSFSKKNVIVFPGYVELFQSYTH